MHQDVSESQGIRVWVTAPRADDTARAASSALAQAGIGICSEGDAPGVLIGSAETCSPEVINQLSEEGNRRLIVVVAPSRLDDPWRLLDAGATEVLNVADVQESIPDVIARLRRWYLVDRLARSAPVTTRLIGDSPAWRRVVNNLVEISQFSDASVLVCGESGTGKELAARLVHALDPQRARGPFVVVDCSTIVATLSAPELFGHERGAFTGAHTARVGAFAEADKGVLFLDEIGELPPGLQPELLRVLQEGTFKPLGSSRWQKTDFRLVCATNRDLDELECLGQFRRDLRSRLSAVTVHLPTLSERRSDIPALAHHFLRQIFGEQAPPLEPAVEAFLRNRRYPGNVRELRQLVTQIAVRHVGNGPITVGMIPEAERPGRSQSPVPGDCLRTAVRAALDEGLNLRTLKSTVADLAVEIALTESGGQMSRAARRLGVTARALQMRRADTIVITSSPERTRTLRPDAPVGEMVT
ncbi:MAG: sigma 54-interacting transcriptional regulator [Actinomycetota bacterium]|nr:sigma 54-interacting transcriptional regulator [Actinomycetota bacterium]